MSRNSSNLRPARRPASQVGFSLLEILAALSIMSLVFLALHLTVGNAVRFKLLASSRVTDQHQGRTVVAWIVDRTRLAGLRTDPASPLARCRDAIVAQDPQYLPTAASLAVTGDVDNDGVAETREFEIQTVDGVPVVTERIAPCVSGAPALTVPLTDATSVRAEALAFAYYNGAGNAVTALTDTAAIQTIRIVEVTVQVRAPAGAQGPTDQTWTTRIALRNP